MKTIISVLPLLLLLTPAALKAGLAEDFQYAWTGVKNYSSQASDSLIQWTKYAGKRAMESIGQDVPPQTQGQKKQAGLVLESLTSGDKSYLNNNKIQLYVTKTGDNQDAAFYALQNSIAVGGHSMNKYSFPFLSALVHHEIQHSMDYKTLGNAGYSLTKLDAGVTAGGNVMDMVSKSILSSVLEARAYSEQAVFAYKQMLAHPGDPVYKAAYADLVAKNNYMETFEKALKEGKSIEEARHLLNTAVLNDENLQKIYLEQDLKGKYHDLFSLSVDDILKILNDGKLTKEDLFKASDFWTKLCSSGKAANSDACREYRRYASLKEREGKTCDCKAYYGKDYCDEEMSFSIMSTKNGQKSCRTGDAAICCPENSEAMIVCPTLTEDQRYTTIECWEKSGRIKFTKPYKSFK